LTGSFEIGFNENVEVDDVVTMSSRAASGLRRRATVGGAETEANKSLGLDPDILFVVSFVVPL
jgi:hypothetical protein